jgi:hypothetical protein
MTGLFSTIAACFQSWVIVDNFFTGDVTANTLQRSSQAQVLASGREQLFGTITDVGLYRPSTDELVLESSLKGRTLPAHLLAMPSLQFLDLHDNLLTGSIPENELENNEPYWRCRIII